MTDILHEDDNVASVTLDDGRVVRNLTADEYAASYAGGTDHSVYAIDGSDETGVAE